MGMLPTSSIIATFHHIPIRGNNAKSWNPTTDASTHSTSSQPDWNPDPTKTIQEDIRSGIYRNV